MNRFFVATPLDFESAALQEMKEIWPFLLGKDAKPHVLPFPEVKVLEGGLEFETELFAGLQLNFFLKTANRVLLRMASFKARDLPKFYQKFKSLPWLEYLHSSHVEWKVAAQKSRLNNEKRLQESAESALQELFPGKTSQEPCGSIFIRMDDDLCTISLDTSGEHLHKRGWTSLRGEAPLRETIASYMLKSLIAEATPTQISAVTLCDPMMGSGTLLNEARALWSGQFLRPYAFQKWKKAPKLFLSSSFALNYDFPAEPVFKKYLGFDISGNMVSIASENFAEVEKQISQTRKKTFKKSDSEFRHEDAIEEAQIKDAHPLWMILNPPYGERLPIAITGGLPQLAATLCSRYKPERLGILYPEKEKVSPVPAGYRVLKENRINNGGLRCLFTVLTRL